MNLEMNLFNGLILLALGFCCGVLSGFFGVGGAFIITPFLNILGLPMINAVATGISFTVFSSLVGGIKHYFQRNILPKVGLIVGVSTLLGVRLSQPLVVYLDQLSVSGFYIRLVYIFLLFLLGSIPLLKQQNQRKKAVPSQEQVKGFPPYLKMYDFKVSLWSLLLIGLFVGFLQGFMGVGGGFILVPLFILILGMESHKAVGTSLLVILISSVFGTYLYLLSGVVVFFVVVVLCVGTSFGIKFGVSALNNISPANLQRFYSTFLLLASLGIVLRQLEMTIISLVYTFSLVLIVTLIIIIKYYYCLTLTSGKVESHQSK